MFDEGINNESVKIVTGYGQVCEVGARVTLGATVELEVDVQVKCLREEDIKEWVKKECQKLSKTDKGKAHKL
jgi:hypothetical protein